MKKALYTIILLISFIAHGQNIDLSTLDSVGSATTPSVVDSSYLWIVNNGPGVTFPRSRRISISRLGSYFSSGGLENLEDDGVNVRSTAGATGAFRWRSGEIVNLGSVSTSFRLTDHTLNSINITPGNITVRTQDIGDDVFIHSNDLIQIQSTGSRRINLDPSGMVLENVDLAFGPNMGTIALPSDPSFNLVNGSLRYDNANNNLVEVFDGAIWSSIGGGGGLANLEDNGAGVRNSASGTGSFDWESVKINGSTISNDLELNVINLSDGSGVSISSDDHIDLDAIGGGSWNFDNTLTISSQNELQLDGGVVRMIGDVLPQGANIIDIGSPSEKFGNGYFTNLRLGAGSSFYSSLQATPTANRTISFQDADGTVAYLGDNIKTGGPQDLVISAGSVSPPAQDKPIVLYHVDTEASAATDDLLTITDANAQYGDIIILELQSNARNVVVIDATGNIECGADFTLDIIADKIMLMYNGGGWSCLSKQSN